jgi:hypothetical protein
MIRWLPLAFVALLLALPAAAQTPDPLPELHRPLSAPTGSVSGPGADASGMEFLRSRAARVEPAALRLAEPEPGDRVALPLFPDREVEVLLEEVTAHGPVSLSLSGPLADGRGRANLVMEGNALAASIVFDDGSVVTLRPRGDGEVVVLERLPGSGPDCATADPEPGTAPVPPPYEPGDALVDPNSPIDILILYTTAARDSLGSTDAIRAWIQLAVDDSNDAYAISSVTHRLRLVGRVETAYNEVGGDFSTDLGRLRADNDGFIDEAHDLRDSEKADLVALVVGFGGFCGLANVPSSTPSPTRAFSINAFNCIDAGGGWTLVHEVGHNLGSGHDLGDSGGIWGFSRGHILTGTTSGNTWSTIMVRRSQPGTRIGYFSNPNVTFDGVACGVPVNQTNEADNSLTFRNVDFDVANYRDSKPEFVFVDETWGGVENGSFDFPYNSLAQGIDEVVYGGIVYVLGSATHTGPALLGDFKPLFLVHYVP